MIGTCKPTVNLIGFRVMNNQFDFLSGIGFDVHAWHETAGDHFLALCGVKVPAHYKIIAHSDGDVGLHALVDAMLGAIAAGDIGEHFPPSDLRWKNADSALFVQHVLKLYEVKKAILINVDITFIGEEPKITPFKNKMKERLSQLLKINPDRINIKATTTEKLGFLGRQEGLAAQAIVSVKIPA